MAEFNLTEEAIDDILYFARALELQSLKAAVEECARSIDKMPRHVLAAAVDESSRCTALHMAAGNGHTGTGKVHSCMTFQALFAVRV